MRSFSVKVFAGKTICFFSDMGEGCFIESLRISVIFQPETWLFSFFYDVADNAVSFYIFMIKTAVYFFVFFRGFWVWYSYSERKGAIGLIRGLHKNIITITDTGSEIFEEAIFILKPQKKVFGRRAMKREALRILREKSDWVQKPGGNGEENWICWFCTKRISTIGLRSGTDRRYLALQKQFLLYICCLFKSLLITFKTLDI